MRDILPEIISIIVIISLCVAVIIGVNEASIKHDSKLWNGGYCDICGGKWEYKQAVGHRYSTSYIYMCEVCGKRIEIHEVR